MVDLVTDDAVDFINHLLVCVKVELGVIQSNDEVRLAPVHCFVDRRLDLQMQRLDVTIEHLVLVELVQELSLAVAIVLRAVLINLTKSDLVQTHLHLCLSLLNLLLTLLH